MPIVQVNEALSDKPSGKLDHSMRVETDQVLHIGQRLTLCMARCEMKPVRRNVRSLQHLMLQQCMRHCMHGTGQRLPVHVAENVMLQ